MAKAREKTATKTARPSPRSGVALPVGAHPKNTGGKPGRSGRVPSAFAEACREAFDRYGMLAVAIDVATRRTQVGADGKVVSIAAKDTDRLAALRFVAEYGYGRPTQPVEVSQARHEDALADLDD